MAQSDAQPVPVRNAACRLTLEIRKNDGTLISGATGVASKVSKDAGNFATTNGTLTEIQTSGIYYLDLLAAEMDADTVALWVTSSSSGAVPVVMVLYPRELGDIPVDVETIAGVQNNATVQALMLSAAVLTGQVDTSTQAATTLAVEVSNAFGSFNGLSAMAAGFYAGRTMIMVSGALKGQAQLITWSTWSSGHSKVTLNTAAGWTSAPGNSDEFLIV